MLQRLLFEQHLNGVCSAVASRIVERCVLVSVLHIDIGALQHATTALGSLAPHIFGLQPTRQAACITAPPALQAGQQKVALAARGPRQIWELAGDLLAAPYLTKSSANMQAERQAL